MSNRIEAARTDAYAHLKTRVKSMVSLHWETIENEIERAFRDQTFEALIELPYSRKQPRQRELYIDFLRTEIGVPVGIAIELRWFRPDRLRITLPTFCRSSQLQVAWSK